MDCGRTVRFIALLLLLVACSQAAEVLTFHNDNARTGQFLSEVILTPSTVNSTNFGLLLSVPADGRVDAQPLYVSGVTIPGKGVHNVLVVATEHDTMYAYDADNGVKLWQVSLLGSGETPSDNRGCGQVSPEIGITGTPVIDRTAGPNGVIYAVAMSKTASSYFQRLHALDLTTGGELFGGPVDVHATYVGTGDGSSNSVVTFDPKMYKARPGLLLMNGIVYTSWSSHCDISPYTAWIIGYKQSTLKQATVLNLTPNGHEASIWQAGAGPAADPGGNIYFLLANGTFDTNLNAAGFPSRGDYGNAFMKLSTAANSLAVADYFATFDTVAQSNADSDLGSGGAIVLPDLLDSQGHTRHLAVGAGKDSHIYVVDRDNMGKFNSSNNNQIYQQVGGLSGGVFATPAFYNGTLYYGAVSDRLKAFRFASGQFPSTATSQSGTAYAYPGTTPSISANGATNGIVWAIENVNPAVLHAYDALNLATELYNSNQAANSRDHFGAGNKYIVPTIANGKVYVATANSVAVFGMLPGSATPVINSPATVSGLIGQSLNYQITATNGPTGFASGPLPSTLAINTSSGVIAGVPAATGSSPASINASNSHGTAVGSVTFNITDPCNLTLTPGTRSFVSSGGTTNTTVSVNTGCPWTASTDSPGWISFTSGSGTGAGAFGVTMASTTGQARLGTTRAGNNSFTVMQNGVPPIFNDVPATSQYFDYISLLSTKGITAGCQANPPLYCPDTPVTRAQMATLLISTMENINHAGASLPLTYTLAPAYFTDAPTTNPYFAFIQRLADLGITKGCQLSPPLFCTESSITQGQMAVFVIEAWLQSNGFSSFTYTQTPYFTDVPSTNIYFAFVQKMRDLGFRTGCSPTTYCVDAAVSRAEMAPMLLRSLFGAP